MRDNVWSATAVSKQTGAIPILKRLMKLDTSIALRLDGQTAATVSATPETRKPKSSSGNKALNLVEVQLRLAKLPLYRGAVDGKYGGHTQRAIQAALVTLGLGGWQNWPKSRLLVAGQQALCSLDGIDAGEIDGMLGDQTRHAIDVYEACLRGDKEPELWRDRKDNSPPKTESAKASRNWPRQKDCSKFYGEPGQNQTRLIFPYPMRLAWDRAKIVRSTSCHEKIHDAASRVLARALDHYGEDRIRKLRLDLYGGCLNVRKMRGGTSWSMHSWGIAFDFDPARNQLKWNHKKARFAKPAYNKWFELWEEEGAISLGRVKDFDWMHVQFARP